MQFTNLRGVALAAMTVAMVACGTPSIQPEDASLNAANSGTLYVFRTPGGIVGAGEVLNVYVDGGFIGGLGDGGTRMRRVPPGKHQITLKSSEMGMQNGFGKDITFDVEAGKDYYLRCGKKLGGVFKWRSLQFDRLGVCPTRAVGGSCEVDPNAAGVG